MMDFADAIEQTGRNPISLAGPSDDRQISGIAPGAACCGSRRVAIRLVGRAPALAQAPPSSQSDKPTSADRSANGYGERRRWSASVTVQPPCKSVLVAVPATHSLGEL